MQVNATTSTNQTAVSSAVNSTMMTGMEDFLELLVAQMQNQDPLEPMQDSDFIAQLAQFSMLDSLNTLQDDLYEMKGLDLLGKEVFGYNDNGDAISGIVASIFLSGDDLMLDLGDDAVLPLKNVSQIAAAVSSAAEGDLYYPNPVVETLAAAYTSAQTLSAEGSATADQIIALAETYIGTPYVMGGNSRDGIDCSAFTKTVFAENGYALPRYAVEQGYSEEYPKIESVEALEKGDLVFFNTIEDSDLCDHVGIYIADGQFIHSGSSTGVIIADINSDYYRSHFTWGRRVLQ